MKNLIILIISLLVSNVFYSQNSNIKQFECSVFFSDYKRNIFSKSNVIAEVKKETPKYMTLGRFKIKETGKVSKAERFAFILKDNEGNTYLNLGKIPHVPKSGNFAKVDIVGKKYLMLALDKDRDMRAYGNPNSATYGGGLMGAALKIGLSPKKVQDTWKDKSGKSYFVFFIDSDGETRKNWYEPINLLDVNTLLKATNNDPEVIQKLNDGNYLLEDFIEFVNKANEEL